MCSTMSFARRELSGLVLASTTSSSPLVAISHAAAVVPSSTSMPVPLHMFQGLWGRVGGRSHPTSLRNPEVVIPVRCAVLVPSLTPDAAGQHSMTMYPTQLSASKTYAFPTACLKLNSSCFSASPTFWMHAGQHGHEASGNRLQELRGASGTCAPSISYARLEVP
jgi:hypothetical protein